MSQHIVRLESKKLRGPVRIQLGWDKPLAEFYLVIFTDPACGSKVEEELVYSNLDDPSSDGKELGYYREIAQGLGCNVPDSMWRAAYQDREFNVVNKVVFYSSTGAVVEPY